MSCIFSGDYNLTPRWSAELIYLENSLYVDTGIHFSHRSVDIGALVSGRDEKLLNWEVMICVLKLLKLNVCLQTEINNEWNSNFLQISICTLLQIILGGIKERYDNIVETFFIIISVWLLLIMN